MKARIVLSYLENILKLAKEIITFEKAFDLSGVSDKLGEYFIIPSMLNKKYTLIFYKTLHDFVKESELYKDLDLTKEENLALFRKNVRFDKVLDNKILEIKKALYPRHGEIIEYLDNFDSGSDIALSNILSYLKQKSLKIDIVSLLFILDDLKKKSKIHSYDGRKVTLN